MSTPFPFTQQHRMAPVIVSRRYHSLPNICTEYIPNELLQLNNARKNKTPLFSYSYDPYKKKKNDPCDHFSNVESKPALPSVQFRSFKCSFAIFSCATIPSFCTRDTPPSTDTEIGYRTRLLRLLMPNIASTRIFHIGGILHATFTTFNAENFSPISRRKK